MFERYCVGFDRSRWLTRFAGVAAVVFLLAGFITASQAQAPFSRLAGQWTGSGSIDLANGRREPIRCRASYVPGGQSNLQINIRCASESYNFDLHASAAYSAGSVSGTWNESTRLVSGTIAGRADGDHIRVMAQSAVFTASLTLTTHGARQSVMIRTQSADASIKGVSIHLRRSS